jgi:hypothetical protein
MADITELYPEGTTDPSLNIKVPAELCFACGNIEHGSVNTKINCLTLNLTNLRKAYIELVNERNTITKERDQLLIEIKPFRRIKDDVKQLPNWKPY